MVPPTTADASQRDNSGWSASQYNANAHFVYSKAYTEPVMEMLDPQPGEKIIDFGCGSGELTIRIREIVESVEGGLVVGFDASQSMIEKAKANGLDNVFVSDCQALQISSGIDSVKFDAVFSNATLHWCKSDPAGVLESAKRVLKNGGRFVIEMGGLLNCVGVRAALHHVLKQRGYDPVELDPWYFPSVEAYSKLLTAASFEIKQISLNPRPTPLPTPGGLFAWLETFARASFLKNMDDDTANEIMNEVVKMCEVDCKDPSTGSWTAMYVRLRVSAVLKL